MAALSSYALISLALAFFFFAGHAPPDMPSSLARLIISGHFVFPGEDPDHDASRDFGNRRRSTPCAVLYPSSADDIAAVVRYVYEHGGASKLTVAVRGHGHSLQGQAQAEGGVVVMMESLKEPGITVVDDEAGDASVEVPAGSLWIDVLLRALEHGLAPRSWTDYLHLSVGGTLSNAGISGQAFRHGPQISNVRSLEIVTGKGEIVNCSATRNSDLYFAALGGLGQFGIITRVRIELERAPSMVKWIRVLYSDFRAFTEDQEMLVSRERIFDYIEGFVVKNMISLLSNWRSFLNPQDPFEASKFVPHGRILFCLEMTKNFDPAESDRTNEEINNILSKLRYIPSTLFYSEVYYVDFLNRVHLSELKLRSKGLWDVPHPWLNLLVPRSRICGFGQEVFGTILEESSNGPVLVYPMTKSRWDNRTSAVTPEEEIFYLVAFLPSLSSPADRETMEILLQQNERILDFGRTAGIQLKQYLPHYTTLEGWKDHFGAKWEEFVRRKLEYDPLAILAPGQRIFRRVTGMSD